MKNCFGDFAYKLIQTLFSVLLQFQLYFIITNGCTVANLRKHQLIRYRRKKGYLPEKR